jgi:hypothetical protein
MFRRMLCCGFAALVVSAMALPSVGAAPDDDLEYPEIPVVWLAGPSMDELSSRSASSNTAAPAQLGALVTADACEDVLPGPQVDLVKTADRTQLTPTQMRLRVTLETSAPPGPYRLRDCIWIDVDNDGIWDEPTETLFGFDTEPIVFTPAPSGPGSIAKFRVNLPVGEDQTVCDRAARSDQLDEPPPSPGPVLISNTLCLEGDPDPVVPESAIVALLPLTAIAVGGAAWAVRRRSMVA